MEGMTLLQNYPIDYAGGMERILQVAGDILMQREELTKPPQTQTSGFGAMIRERVWKGITNQSAVEVQNNSPEDSDDDTTDEAETENENETENERARSNTITQATATSSGWGSYFKSTVMRGITNESAMDPDSPGTSPLPTPVPSPNRSSHDIPSAAPSSPRPEERPALLAVPSTGPGLWNYAEKLRQSDMAAKLARASTNLSAKALDAWASRSAGAQGAPVSEKQQLVGIEATSPKPEYGRNGFRHASMPNIQKENVYSPPPRPAHFKPPRDTRMFSADEINSLQIPDSPESSHSSLSASTLSAGSHTRAGSLASVLPSWVAGQPKSPSRSPKPTKAAPKPLLLSASSLVTANHISRSANSTPTPRNPEWSEFRNSMGFPSPQRKDSEFSEVSVSSRHSNHSASPKAALSGWDSDQSVSRVVRLNRQSISPMAPAFRINRSSRNPSISSQSEFGMLLHKTATDYRTASEGSPQGSNGRAFEDDARPARPGDRVSPDSPATLPSSPPPRTPDTNSGLGLSSVRVANAERQRGSLVLSESGFSGLDAPPQGKRAPRRPSSTTIMTTGDTSDSSAPAVSPLTRNTARVRSKRFNGAKIRPPSLRARTPEARNSMHSISPSSLAAPEFDSEHEMATTPRAMQFPSTSPTEAQAPRSPRRRKVSMEGPERRRKLSGEANGTRTRKVSAESRNTRTRKVSGSRRDSHANDGDDEGYDELLSAYESEASNSKYESAASSEA